MDFETVNLKDFQHRYFEEAWNLYESSFPLEEKRTLEEQKIKDIKL